MKKIIAIILALVLCVSLFACGKDADNEIKDAGDATAVATAEITAQPTATPVPTAEPTQAPQYYGKENIALNKPVEVDSVQDAPSQGVTEDEEEEDEPIINYKGENAVDGDFETRWSRGTSDAPLPFIKIDLEKTYKIGFVAITWESCQSAFYIELLDENGERVEYKYCNAAATDDIELYTEDFFNGKEARYVVVYVSKTLFCSPYEIEVHEQLVEKPNDQDEKINLALSGTASSDYVEKQFTPDKANDGDLTTRWAPGGNGFPNDVTWTLDLGAVKTVDEINIYFESNQAEYIIEIATEENGQWETVYEWIDTDVAGKTNIQVGGKDARFVRYLRPAGAEGWCSFYEVEVFGTEK